MLTIGKLTHAHIPQTGLLPLNLNLRAKTAQPLVFLVPTKAASS